MKPEELRIGNYVDIINRTGEVHVPMGVVKQIGEIKHSTVTLYDPQIPWAQQQFSYNVGIKDLSPIKLSEEWLLNFKFKYQDRDINAKEPERFYISDYFGENREYWLELNLPRKPFNHCFIWLNCDIGGGRKHVHLPNHNFKYIHQLQNLYFDLTDEELIIKEQ